MKKQIKLLAVLSTAAAMSVVTPNLIPAFTGLSMTSLAQTVGWVEEDEQLRYKDSDGYYLTDTWKKKDGEWYYLNEDGFISRSTTIDEYYVDESGKRVISQWISVENEDEWSDDEPEMYWSYYGKDGRSTVSKWLNINGSNYYFNDEGHMETGMIELDGYTYYLGDHQDGVMKTGWVQLENENEDLDTDMVWHFFDHNGRMVMNQVDRKINGNYYTFVNGVMHTGWFKLPAEEISTATVSDAASTELPEIASYQYYEADGKRGNGWYEMEGAPGISEEDETYTFYIKNGKPHYAASGIQVFSIDSKRYGFNTKGERQTGLQVVTLEDGETGNFYFGTDGVVKTGKQTIYNEYLDENETWFFYTDGANRGRGFHGIKDNNVYQQGLRLDADRDLRYAPVSLDGVSYLVNASGAIQKASASSKSTSRPELENGFKDVKDANDKIWTVDTNGIIIQ